MKKKQKDNFGFDESDFGKTTRTLIQGAVLIEFGKLLKK